MPVVITFKFGASFGTFHTQDNMVVFGGMRFQIEAAGAKLKAAIMNAYEILA